MLFNTIQYILFLPFVTAVYFLLPHKVRHVWLLAASWYFYMQWNPKYILLLAGCTLVTYTGARILEGMEGAPGRRKAVLFACLAVNLGILGFFKYYNFGTGLMNRFLGAVHLPQFPALSIILPVGISFFTLQALGYLIDVYRGDVPAEHDFIRYALFVSFFPQLVAGPIERSGNLMHQLSERHSLTYENVRRGLLLILYGLFLKMVIADRVSPIVDAVYNDPASWPGFGVAFATFLFAIQIYCDFYGYSVIAAGSARILGIRLMSNFEAPFLSASVRELWSRWHISLSTWFRDYLYFPLGGGRAGLGKKIRNLLIIFGVSGLWHGASLGFVFWGLLNGLFQSVEAVAQETAKKGDSKAFPARIRTFLLFLFSLIFFRAGGMQPAFRTIRYLFSSFNPEILTGGSFFTLGQGMKDFRILAGAVLVLFLTDLAKYLGKRPDEQVLACPFPVRYLVMAGLFFSIILFGCYGDTYNAQQFIYFQF